MDSRKTFEILGFKTPANWSISLMVLRGAFKNAHKVNLGGMANLTKIAISRNSQQTRLCMEDLAIQMEFTKVLIFVFAQILIF